MSKSGLAYIRDYYRVPAYLDVRVRLEDGRWAEIVGSEGAYLEVFVDGARTKSIVHPNGCGYRPEGTSQRVDELVAERDTLVARLTEAERRARSQVTRAVDAEARTVDAEKRWETVSRSLELEWYAALERAGALAVALGQIAREPCRFTRTKGCGWDEDFVDCLHLRLHVAAHPERYDTNRLDRDERCGRCVAVAALAAAGDVAKGETE